MLNLIDFTGRYAELLASAPMERQRFLAERINWRARLIGLVGGRGVGKTTLLLQALARSAPVNAPLTWPNRAKLRAGSARELD